MTLSKSDENYYIFKNTNETISKEKMIQGTNAAKIEYFVHANISQIKTASFQCVAKKHRITHAQNYDRKVVRS